jgi:hypothetical protein
LNGTRTLETLPFCVILKDRPNKPQTPVQACVAMPGARPNTKVIVVHPELPCANSTAAQVVMY